MILSIESHVNTLMSFYLFCRYPVILSIENHCSTKQQQAMAHYMSTIFGSKLFTGPIDENATYLPSPEKLNRKILVKVRTLFVDLIRVEILPSSGFSKLWK